uniref:PDZ domain-containing protein n=1 Tax=Globisporangium ultimum (strain ATCC 200006 / CBS 805.95 / DAOM BR144) TaxID=431595 RepID=K3WD32_GLOUD
MESALVDGISRALGVPRPFVHEENAAFTLVEDWKQLAVAVVNERIRVKPLGYYRSPESIDIYVFECTMGTDESDTKTWKIYRRYRHFQRYVSNSSELLASVVVPRLSQAYLKIFYAKQCKDRLVELHAWLVGVIENTQRFFQQRAAAAVASQQHAFMQHMDTPEAMPAVWLCAFLFAGANSPFPHYFRGLPSFAVALEEVNVELTKAPIFPSKLRSSIETSAGLGLRLTPSLEQHGNYFGATVSGFLRDVADLDPTLTKVQIGAKLVRINGVNVADEPFDKVLSQLRSVGLPLRLRFLYNPQLHRRQRGKSMYVDESNETLSPAGPLGRERRLSSVSARSSASAQQERSNMRSRSSVASTASMSSPFTKATAFTASGSGASVSTTSSQKSAGGQLVPQRRYSVDSRKSMGIFSSVFGDLFGRKRNETADVLFHNQVEELYSWDDIGGETRDIVSRGFFSFLTQSFLHELRQKERLKYDESALDDPTGKLDEEKGDAALQQLKALNERKGQGVWSTSTGAMGFSFGACKLHDVEAAMLDIPPVFFSSRLGCIGSEKHLGKGFVLVSINNESTFGLKFSAVMKMLTKASRPTSVCFRWYKDYSPFLETDLTEQEPVPTSGSGPPSYRRSSKSDPLKAFEHSLDCLTEAQSDLCSNLHLALVENASIRNEIGVLQERQRESRRRQEQAEHAKAEMKAVVQEKDAVIAKLRQELATRDTELQSAKEKCKVSNAMLASSKQEFHQLLENAHAAAIQRVAEHEERLVRESNKSIENAKLIAERKTKKELDAALSDLQRKHDEYLQKLAEEHSEEVESLMQQVVVWRHQVEVLTEAEKRNYAAMIHNGVNPYHDYQRSRFGFADSPFVDNSGRTSSTARTLGGGRHTNSERDALGTPSHPHSEYESWRDGTPEDPKDHAFTELSDRSSMSNSQPRTTFWDRMVSLIAD